MAAIKSETLITTTEVCLSRALNPQLDLLLTDQQVRLWLYWELPGVSVCNGVSVVRVFL